MNFLRRLALQDNKKTWLQFASRSFWNRASLICFRACFLPGRSKDLSVPLYIQYASHVSSNRYRRDRLPVLQYCYILNLCIISYFVSAALNWLHPLNLRFPNLLVSRIFSSGSVHRNSRLKKSNKMPQYADIYLLLNYSTCFGRPSHPSSGVHKTVVAAFGTDHTVWGASFFKSGWGNPTRCNSMQIFIYC